MLYYNNKRLLSEGMSLEQIKEGKNPELLGMFEDFKRRIFHESDGVRSQLSPKIEKFFVEYMNNLYNSGNPMSNDFLQMKLAQAETAYAEYILVNVLEYHQDYVDELDLNNPTNGLRGKFTEFILRILSSSVMKNSKLDMKSQFIFIDFFIQKIFKIPASKVYQTKNMFFDNVIIPLMDERVRNGEKLGSINSKTGIKGANFSRPSPTASLSDKIMKVFDAYGIYNGKNLLETIIEEVVPEKAQKEIETFAGYDIKLIDYCLAKKYWKEIHVPGQPNSTRLFFIGDGDIESLPQPSASKNNKIDEDRIWEQWSELDYEEQQQWGDYDNYMDFMVTEFGTAYLEKDPRQQSFSYYFVSRALIYACNIYPFKTTYNIAKGMAKVSSREIAFYKSLSDDDYIVPMHIDDVKIRKTTDWCTKDDEQLSKYIMPENDGQNNYEKYDGFVLCLNDALPFNDPDGALQIGIKVAKPEKFYYIGDSYPELTVMNADDHSAHCPEFFKKFFDKYSGTTMKDIINQEKQNYNSFRNLNFPETEKKMSADEKKKYFEKMVNSINETLLRKYISCLLS
jgi:hypothetical protein